MPETDEKFLIRVDRYYAYNWVMPNYIEAKKRLESIVGVENPNREDIHLKYRELYGKPLIDQ